MTAKAIGGVEDHVHVLLSLPSTLAIAKAIQLIKGGSSKWVRSTPDTAVSLGRRDIAQFSLGISQVDRTVAYIESQARHHRTQTFQDEFLAFLKKHKMEYDERYICD